jgi:hypothetical protein
MTSVWDSLDLDTYLNSIINEAEIEGELVQEARWKVAYRETQLRRRELVAKHAEAMALDARHLNWEDLGVSDQAIESLVQNGTSQDELHRYFAHPDVLRSTDLLHYYRTLAGVSENRLRKLDSVKPAVRELRSGTSSAEEEESLRRLCRFFNSLLSAWATSLTNEDPSHRSLISALLTEGAAIEGSSRNAGGRKAVVNVASVLVEDLSEHEVLDSFYVKQTAQDEFTEITARQLGDSYTLGDLSGAYDVHEVRSRNGGVVNLDQSEPDMVVRSQTGITGYGEIKDRKDVSNQWEGWLPLIRSKLEDFDKRESTARRMLFQPVYTRRMIDGVRGSDAEDVGVRELVRSGLLDVPFNITRLIEDEDAREFFGGYLRQLLGYEVDVVR